MATLLRVYGALTQKLAVTSGWQAETVSNALILTFVSIAAALLWKSRQPERLANLPPVVSYSVPFLGSMISFGVNPLQFLRDNHKRYGDCFTFLMFGRKMTYMLGPEGNNFVFNARIANVSAEEAYRNLTVPVFGKEVVYDVENAVLMQQKKFVKDALSVTALRSYGPAITEETNQYFERWGTSGSQDAATALAELTILTASRCLMGKEIRAQLDETVAQLYLDLDNGFTPINFLFPYLPLPSCRRRDAAQKKMANLFLKIMKERRQNKDEANLDVLQTLMTAIYKDGKPMSDVAVAHLMIALLMAGQHTSSTTGTWALLFLAQNPHLIQDLLKEQKSYFEKETGREIETIADLPELDYESLKSLKLLDSVVKESLRLRPPIVVILRKVIKDIEYKGYTIPAGHYIGGSPAVSQLDEEQYKDAEKFDPYRHFNKPDEEKSEWTINGVDIAEKSAKSHYLPFGAGRHRCIGESFAYVQLKTILGTFIRTFDFSLSVDPKTGTRHLPERCYETLVVMPKKPTMVDYTRRDPSTRLADILNRADGHVAKNEMAPVAA